jgi:hypothetical protein
MKSKWSWIALVGCLVFLLVSCNGTGTPTLPDETLAQPASPPMVTDTGTESEMPQPTSPPGMESLIEKAKEDLAQRLSVPITQINLIEAKEVVWPDASLGCPQPGMRYKQIPEDGALIVLQVQGTTYEYHNGGSRGLFLCEKVVSITEKSPKIDITNLTPQILDKNNPPPSTPSEGIPPGEDQ